MRIDDERPEIPEVGMPRGRQCKPVAHPLARFVRAGDRIERKGKVARRSRHRTDHGKIALPRHRWRRRQTVSAQRDQPERRLVSEDPAEMRWYAYRPTDVGSKRKWAEAGSKRRRRSPRRATGRAADVPGIVGRSVDLIIALELAKPRRDVGFADNDCAGLLQPRHGERILGRHKIPELR